MISAIVLNYKTPKATLKCVESLMNQRYISNVIVVNNGIKDNTLDECQIGDDGTSVFIVHTGANLGYARGNNYGVSFVLREKISHDYLLVVNSDIIVPSEFSFTPLIDKISKNPSIAIISPTIIDLNT